MSARPVEYASTSASRLFPTKPRPHHALPFPASPLLPRGAPSPILRREGSVPLLRELLTDLFLLEKKKKKTVQKTGGFQVDNEASMAPKQSRASVMSVQTNELVGAERGDGGTPPPPP